MSTLPDVQAHQAGFNSFIKAFSLLIVGVTILLVFMVLVLV